MEDATAPKPILLSPFAFASGVAGLLVLQRPPKLLHAALRVLPAQPRPFVFSIAASLSLAVMYAAWLSLSRRLRASWRPALPLSTSAHASPMREHRWTLRQITLGRFSRLLLHLPDLFFFFPILFSAHRGSRESSSKPRTIRSTLHMPVHPPLLRRSLAPTNLSEIETQATLGIGTFATVSLVSYSVDGELKPYALKTLCKEKLVRYEQIEHTINEAKLLASFHHPFIAKLEAVFESPTACHLLLEPVMGGELFARIRLQRRLSEAEALCYSMMVAAALDYLHARRVAYRDLKPENLLLDERGYLKLVDFGFAKEVVDRTWTLCGTPEYMAPEVILNEGHGVGVDWWALGILFYEMVTGVLPFGGQGVDDHMLWRQVVVGEFTHPTHLSPEALSFLDGLLATLPTLRLGCGPSGSAEVINHAIFAHADWDALLAREIPAPYVPCIASAWDVSHFNDPANGAGYGEKVITAGVQGLQPTDDPHSSPSAHVADIVAGEYENMNTQRAEGSSSEASMPIDVVCIRRGSLARTGSLGQATLFSACDFMDPVVDARESDEMQLLETMGDSDSLPVAMLPQGVFDGIIFEA